MITKGFDDVVNLYIFEECPWIYCAGVTKRGRTELDHESLFNVVASSSVPETRKNNLV